MKKGRRDAGPLCFLLGRPEAYPTGLHRFAGANRANQAAVVIAVFIVPEWQAQLQAPAEDIDLLLRTSRGVGRIEIRLCVREPVLIVPVLQNGLKHVLAAFHGFSRRVDTFSRAVMSGWSSPRNNRGDD